VKILKPISSPYLLAHHIVVIMVDAGKDAVLKFSILGEEKVF